MDAWNIFVLFEPEMKFFLNTISALFLVLWAFSIGGVAVWLDQLVQGLRDLGFALILFLFRADFMMLCFARYLRLRRALEVFRF